MSSVALRTERFHAPLLVVRPHSAHQQELAMGPSTRNRRYSWHSERGNSLSVPAPTQGIAIRRILLATAGVADGRGAALHDVQSCRAPQRGGQRHLRVPPASGLSILRVIQHRHASPFGPPRRRRTDRRGAATSGESVGAESGRWAIALSVGHVGRCISEARG